MQISVGIIMHAKNQMMLFKRALKSVTNQSYPHWKLVIINDNDETEIMKKILTHYEHKWQDRMTVIHCQKSEIGNIINLGLDYLNTDLAVIHSINDGWSPDFLLRMTTTYVEQKRRFSNIGGIICHTNKVIETIEGNIIRVNKTEDFNQSLDSGILSLKSIADDKQLTQINFVFELGTCKEVGMYDESLPILYDWDFYLRFISKKDIWVLAETLAFHHQSIITNSNKDTYRLYKTYLENKWLRQDLNSGSFGIGAIMAFASNHSHILEE